MEPSQASTAALAVQGVSKRYGTLVAVDAVDLGLAPGQFMALLGPSGCGKTTLLRLIAGFEQPDAGVISVGGRTVVSPCGAGLPPEQRSVGMVFQDYALFPHLSVEQNVAYGLGRSPERAARAADLLALVGLEGAGRRLPHQLSGGQQQRVALARALAPRPALLLLDEPFSNLDAGLRQAVRAEVRQILRREGVSALFVTHDQEEALSLADVVAVMLGGRVAQVARPRELYERPATREVAAFVGAANFLPGEADGATASCAFGTLALARP
ncbi:MAG TPA: ABC transporter ATP-binding protein, partial [Chloroflexaceae bacterium]|nr:ABC transporter ATP-binding protein [Chloroflexaceae bacterium]